MTKLFALMQGAHLIVMLPISNQTDKKDGAEEGK